MPTKRTKQQDAYFQHARDHMQKDGEVEIDDDARVSLSEDGGGVCGAYVQAWIWVPKDALTKDE
jgi:hypothetical protein